MIWNKNWNCWRKGKYYPKYIKKRSWESCWLGREEEERFFIQFMFEEWKKISTEALLRDLHGNRTKLHLIFTILDEACSMTRYQMNVKRRKTKVLRPFYMSLFLYTKVRHKDSKHHQRSTIFPIKLRRINKNEQTFLYFLEKVEKEKDHSAMKSTRKKKQNKKTWNISKTHYIFPREHLR